jgi:tRNA (adenine37-N6)-methyltransferase
VEGNILNREQKYFCINPIGHVRRDGDGIFIHVDEEFREGLQNLDGFSHVIVLCWAEKFDDVEMRKTVMVSPPYAPERTVGVFSTRSPRRPNPILLTPCRILEVNVETGCLQVQNLDVFDGTPVIDLKAYYPVSDRVKDVKIAEWMSDWPEWVPEDGLGLEG